MAIQDEMYKAIENEINRIVESGKVKADFDANKVKEVAKMLTSLSTDNAEAETLTNQYIANIKNICNDNQ